MSKEKDSWKGETFEIDKELLLVKVDKVEIIDCIGNFKRELKYTFNTAVITVAILQYLGIVGSVWAMIYYMHY
jgi:hypothetical protein